MPGRARGHALQPRQAPTRRDPGRWTNCVKERKPTNPSGIRIRSDSEAWYQAEAGRDDVHFLFPSLNDGLGSATARRDSWRLRPNRADPRPEVKSAAFLPRAVSPRPETAKRGHDASRGHTSPRPVGSHRGPEAGLTDRSIVAPPRPKLSQERRKRRRPPCCDGCASQSVRSGEARTGDARPSPTWGLTETKCRRPLHSGFLQ